MRMPSRLLDFALRARQGVASIPIARHTTVAQAALFANWPTSEAQTTAKQLPNDNQRRHHSRASSSYHGADVLLRVMPKSEPNSNVRSKFTASELSGHVLSAASIDSPACRAERAWENIGKCVLG